MLFFIERWGRGFFGDVITKTIAKGNKTATFSVLITWCVPYFGVGNGNPLQYSCLKNPMDRGDWQATIHGVAKESTTT